MSSKVDPSLRVVKHSGDSHDDSKDTSSNTASGARGASMQGEAAALASPALPPVSGEIQGDRASRTSGVSTNTLLGVPAFPAGKTGLEVDGAQLFVSPATVTAIAKTKYPTDPSLKRLTDPSLKKVTDPALKVVDGADTAIPLTKKKESLPKLEIARDPIPLDKLPAADEPAPGKWHKFEDLGLAPHPTTRKAQKLLVSTYRLFGFGILTLIVVVLVSYIATTAFYFLNHTWVAPVALSPNDEKVVGLQGELAGLLNERAKLVGDLAEAERSIRAEQDFQIQFGRAIKKDLEGRRVALDRVQALAQTAATTRTKIRTANDDFSQVAAATDDANYSGNLIDRNSMLAGKYQLAQITSANLSLAERQAEYDQRAAELAVQTQSLDAILADKTATAALSYDVLKIARDYDTSKLSLQRELSNRERLKASLERQDKIIQGVTQSAYLRALADNATVALVPYANLGNIEKGTPLYACKLEMVWCHEVGKVLEVLPGEVQVKHPNRDSMLRGRMIELQMTDIAAAQDEVLFAGSKPFGF